MATYKPLQTLVVPTDGTTSVTFSGIDQGYTDLILVGKVFATGAFEVRAQLNGSTSGYSSSIMEGTGSSATASRENSATSLGLCYGPGSATVPTIHVTHFNGYANSTTYKPSTSKAGNAASNVLIYQGMYRSTSPITSITLNLTSTKSYYAGTTFSLYGIKSGAPQALGGDLVTTDGNYWYHTFRSTQTFTPLRALSVDYLVVAGGGGANLAGGGAGGVRSTVTATGGGGSLESALSLTAQAYTVTIGAGGATATPGNNGSNTTFASITSTGGGGGNQEGNGAAGGSGGGGGTGASATTRTGGAASPSGQGYAGGGTGGSNDRSSGGGGGAGAVGNTNASGQNGAGGGAGITVMGLAVGGGGGGGGRSAFSNGSGISYGGGYGGTYPSPDSTAGTANTGGGGGGGWNFSSNGGSGIVIVRYAV